MTIFARDIPLSLYIHLPWCIRKCPYCDFNSHEINPWQLPEERYVTALLQELDGHLPLIKDRAISSIFFGGGTPSLFSPKAIGRILHGIAQRAALGPQLEITLEANPGTIDQAHFGDFLQAGINRLSIGIQSLQNDKLNTLGRIHNRDHALRAITLARELGFHNVNFDIMYGLPQQTLADALSDLETALAFKPTHFSWYQLTIEPNTLFYKQRPVLPVEDAIWEMQIAGQQILTAKGMQQYEISAYAQAGKECVHNLNYWQFGDYLGIGAGAHSKITDHAAGKVLRFAQTRHPKDYLDPHRKQATTVKTLSDKDLIFEFMLNALRLVNGVPFHLFTQRTGLSLEQIQPIVTQAIQRGLLLPHADYLSPSAKGITFLNELTAMFL